MDNGTLTPTLIPALPSALTQSQNSPSWSMIFALILVILLMGFFVMYLIFRMSRQEKMIEVLNKKTQEIPTPSDVIDLIHECYGSPQFQQPMMRNIHSIIETRLNDFDSYCKEKYGKESKTDTEPSDLHVGDENTMPALEEKDCNQENVKHNAHSIRIDPHPNHSSSVAQSQPHSSHQPSQPSQHSHPSQPSQPQPRQESRSILAEAIPSLLSMFTGGGLSGNGNSATQLGGDVSFPVIIGDIMTLMNNQQVRQRRRERMAPSEPLPSTSESSPPTSLSQPTTTESS